MSESEAQYEVSQDENAGSSPDNPIITVKDPKRVEQGKRLVAISKEAKEKKMRQRIREEDFSYLPWIGYCVAGFSSIGFLYLLFSGSAKHEPEFKHETIVKTPPPSPKKKKFESF